MGERIKKGPELILPMSAVDVLKKSALMISRLEEQARLELVKQNAVGYNERMIDKALTLAQLPDELQELSERNILVPEEIKNLSMGLSKSAKRAIRDNNYFVMSVLLKPIGIQAGEPNELKKFIDHLEKNKSLKK
ncbi:hypothetical protein KKF69_08565 [Patescibacteria group bacterium]|nr:hypothetical protein [Patescibacteria group bacterium]